MRQTKIIATVGPASGTPEMLDQLIAAGADVFRLNFSHGTHETHATTFARIREAASRAGRDVAILQDLGGPKIRTGPLQGGGPIALDAGQRLTIATGSFEGDSHRISTSFAGLARSVRAGDRLLLADGQIELRVDDVDGAEIHTTVVDGGSLGAHKGINAPGVPLPASSLTMKDAEDLEFGLGLGVDLVAISFVQSASDLHQARALMKSCEAPDVPLIAKLERPQALEDLDGVLAASDAVMVARGDLGLEVPFERLPRIQKDITRRARQRRIPVIVATQVLESMTTEPRPTRAEVTDAANAVEDGVDAIMLAAETAIGAFPARAVQTLNAIICDAEANGRIDVVAVEPAPGYDHAEALCAAAVDLADRVNLAGIVAVTRGGGTARMLSALRPRVPVFATTDRPEMARRLSLYRSVLPVCTDIGEDVDATGTLIGQQLIARGLLPAGCTVALVSINPDLARRDANYLKIQRL